MERSTVMHMRKIATAVLASDTYQVCCAVSQQGGDRVMQSPEQLFSSPDLRILRSMKSRWEQLCKFIFMDKVSIYFRHIIVPSLLRVGRALQRKHFFEPLLNTDILHQRHYSSLGL